MSVNWPVGEGRYGVPVRADDWSGNCDVVAVALHREFGLPIEAEFEWGLDGEGKETLGFLVHAWVVLPDGRTLDAWGAKPPKPASEGRDGNDPWVMGYRIVRLAADDPHLIEIRETDRDHPFEEEIRDSKAGRWMRRRFGRLVDRARPRASRDRDAGGARDRTRTRGKDA